VSAIELPAHADIPEGYTSYEDWDTIYFRGDSKSKYVFCIRGRTIRSVTPMWGYKVSEDGRYLEFTIAPPSGLLIAIELERG
jgi:hypothetical protein